MNNFVDLDQMDMIFPQLSDYNSLFQTSKVAIPETIFSKINSAYAYFRAWSYHSIECILYITVQHSGKKLSPISLKKTAGKTFIGFCFLKIQCQSPVGDIDTLDLSV
jgi:hypothetical protein